MTESKMNWARLTSDVFCPPVVWGLLSLPVAFRFAPSTTEALIWSAVYIGLVCIVPALYIGLNVKLGRISDIHMKRRQERFGPFLVSLGCAGLSWLILRQIGASPAMPMMTAFTLAQLAVMTLITFVWQISMHAMSVGGALATTGILFGPLPALVLAPLIPLVGTARLRLERHTPAQVIAGTLVGVFMTMTLFALV